MTCLLKENPLNTSNAIAGSVQTFYQSLQYGEVRSLHEIE